MLKRKQSGIFGFKKPAIDFRDKKKKLGYKTRIKNIGFIFNQYIVYYWK